MLLTTNLTKELPTFGDMVKYYGPYLGLVLSLIIAILILQFIWFNRILKTKTEEINRLVKREEELNERILSLMDKEIGYRKNNPKK